MKILIPKIAVLCIAKGAVAYSFVQPNASDLQTADFLLFTFHHGGQLLTLKQAFKIHKRLQTLHNHPNRYNPKIERAILLNGGTPFYHFLTRNLFCDN